jgi:hypothetical protein
MKQQPLMDGLYLKKTDVLLGNISFHTQEVKSSARADADLDL